MTAPNAARDAQPGQRFTDPHDGTWVRIAVPWVTSPWVEIDSDGEPHWRSQEEAEAAGLVAVVAQTEVAQARRERDEALAEMRAERIVPPDQGESRTDADRAEDAELFLAQWPGGKRLTTEDRADFIAGWTGWHAGADFAHECDVRDLLAAAAPAPLDPGNPEHLRQHVQDARAIEAHYDGKFVGFDAGSWPLGWVLEQAERLDREHAEAEQAAADLELIEDARLVQLKCGGDEFDFGMALLRAERARAEGTKP